MKIKYYIVTGIIFCAFSAYSALAADGDIDNDAPGGEVKITTSVAGAQPIVFNPSTNVNMLGTSSASSYAVIAWHQQAVDKDSGQAFAMAADENKMFFMDISENGEAVPTTIGTNFAGLGDDWNTM